MSTVDSFSQGAPGEPVGLFCAANAMTEQRRIQEAARQREAYLASLVDIQRQLLSLKDALTPAHLEPLLASLGRVAQVSLTFDHRVCDGGVAGGFVRYVADCIESPAVLLGEA